MTQESSVSSFRAEASAGQSDLQVSRAQKTEISYELSQDTVECQAFVNDLMKFLGAHEKGKFSTTCANLVL